MPLGVSNPFGGGSTGPGGSGSAAFPTSPTASVGQQIIDQVNAGGQQAVTQWFSERNITSSYESMYYVPGSTKLGPLAADLEQYYQDSTQERLQKQQDMVNAGLLTGGSATGQLNTANDIAAYKDAIANAYYGGYTSVDSYLTSQGSAFGQAATAIGLQSAQAQKDLTTPLTINTTPTATIAQSIVQAFNQNDGIQATQDEIAQFTKDVIGQETQAQSAPRVQGQEEANLVKTETNQLDALGANGIDIVLQAYAKAVGGLPGGNTPQGPQVGTQTPIGQQSLAAGRGITTQPTYTLGQSTEGIAPPTGGVSTAPGLSQTQQDWNARFGPGGSARGGKGAGPESTNGLPAPQQTITNPGQNVTEAPNPADIPPGSPALYGGIYALTPAEWTQAQKIDPVVAKYAKSNSIHDAGQAPVAIQKQAATALFSQLYDQSGNWATVVSQMGSAQGGSPLGKAKGTGGLTSLGNSIVNQVNAEAASLLNETQNASVTVKTSNPTSADISAEAAQFAKTAHPAEYYAGNAGTWGSFFSKAMYGNPLQEMQPTTSFAGPVGSAGVTAESAPGATASESGVQTIGGIGA